MVEEVTKNTIYTIDKCTPKIKVRTISLSVLDEDLLNRMKKPGIQ